MRRRTAAVATAATSSASASATAHRALPLDRTETTKAGCWAAPQPHSPVWTAGQRTRVGALQTRGLRKWCSLAAPACFRCVLRSLDASSWKQPRRRRSGTFRGGGGAWLAPPATAGAIEHAGICVARYSLLPARCTTRTHPREPGSRWQSLEQQAWPSARRLRQQVAAQGSSRRPSSSGKRGMPPRMARAPPPAAPWWPRSPLQCATRKRCSC